LAEKSTPPASVAPKVTHARRTAGGRKFTARFSRGERAVLHVERAVVVEHVDRRGNGAGAVIGNELKVMRFAFGVRAEGNNVPASVIAQAEDSGGGAGWRNREAEDAIKVERKDGESPYTLHRDLQEAMQNLVGIFRTKEDLIRERNARAGAPPTMGLTATRTALAPVGLTATVGQLREATDRATASVDVTWDGAWGSSRKGRGYWVGHATVRPTFEERQSQAEEGVRPGTTRVRRPNTSRNQPAGTDVVPASASGRIGWSQLGLFQRPQRVWGASIGGHALVQSRIPRGQGAPARARS
jgi:hypothetical protein